MSETVSEFSPSAYCGGKRREARIWTQMDPSSGSYADYVRQSK